MVLRLMGAPCVTVRWKVWDTDGRFAESIVKVRVYEPGSLAAPFNVAVPSRLSVNVNPFGSDRERRLRFGGPTVSTVKLKVFSWTAVADVADVNRGCS